MTSASRFCQRCGEDIPRRRLEVLPATRLCLTCSEEIGGDYISTVIPEHTGKTNSLKRNYGSWTVKRRLRKIARKEKPDNR